MAAKNSLWFVTPAVVATGVALALALASEPPEDIATGPTASRVPDTTLADTGDLVSLLERLAPSAAGATSGELAIAEANNPDALLAGSEAAPAPEGPMRGRVEQLYVRVAEGVLLEWEVANLKQREGWRYAAVEFPDPLANGASKVLALVPDAALEPGLGDVVEVRLANKSGRRLNAFFNLERDKITRVVAKKDTPIAAAFGQRFAARTLEATSADWGALPLERAVKIVRGSGEHEVAVFTDPNCSACQALERNLEQVDDVTIYVFMTPVIRQIGRAHV